MATILCPRGCRWISKRKLISFEFRNVQIFNGVCDHSDRCEITDCEFFDNTEEGERQYIKGLYYSHTLQGMIADKQFEDEHRAKPSP